MKKRNCFELICFAFIGLWNSRERHSQDRSCQVCRQRNRLFKWQLSDGCRLEGERAVRKRSQFKLNIYKYEWWRMGGVRTGPSHHGSWLGGLGQEVQVLLDLWSHNGQSTPRYMQMCWVSRLYSSLLFEGMAQCEAITEKLSQFFDVLLESIRMRNLQECISVNDKVPRVGTDIQVQPCIVWEADWRLFSARKSQLREEYEQNHPHHQAYDRKEHLQTGKRTWKWFEN